MKSLLKKMVLAGFLASISMEVSWAQAPLTDASLLAFPGAEGFGAYSVGGRGGKVIYVTNLNDGGPGSLREAVEQEGPRTVVFAVGGVIILQKKLEIKHPYLTIAGQTAPGDGICLRGQTLEVLADHVIIRYLRVRLGDGLHGKGSLQGKDAISVSAGKNIIVDHCSASWSLDEILSASSRRPSLDSVTVQWCFITEGLNPDKHGYGSLIRGTGGVRYSYLHNLYAHNIGRNPRPGNYIPYTQDPKGLLLDFRNNVIYNWGGGHAGYNRDENTILRMNYVNNYLIPGVDSDKNGYAYSTGSPYNKAYFAGNYFSHRSPDNQWSLVEFRSSWTPEQVEAFKQSQPFETGPVRTENAVKAYKRVLKEGGATLPQRDEIDKRIVNEVKHQGGRIIESQDEVGGWPIYESAAAQTDTDMDGMPDVWEDKNGLDKNNPADRNMLDVNSGYTMLECYLDGLIPKK